MKNTEKTALIVCGALGAAALVTGALVAVRHSKKYRAMRAVRRTNMVLRRVGHALTRMAEISDACV